MPSCSAPVDAETACPCRWFARCIIPAGLHDSFTLHAPTGIPFAQPPTGNLRFQAPQPLPDSNDDIDASTIQPTCFQPNNYVMSFNGRDGMSEDCLHLNIFTPKGASTGLLGKLPVMHWYFGGGDIGGAATTYNASALVLQSMLMLQPMIVVTSQYRMNAFGFLAGEAFTEASKTGDVVLNPGLRDVTAAIEWTKKNIAAFGGDPNKITIAGQSSGAFNIGAQLLKDGAPGAADPVYRAAVLLSGTMGTEPAWSPNGNVSNSLFNRVANAVGCDPSSSSVVSCMRNADPLDLAQATFPGGNYDAPEVPTLQGPDFYPGIFMYQPVVDGIYHRQQGAGAQVAAGQFPDVPMLTGNVKDEGTIFAAQQTRLSDWPSYLSSVAFENPQGQGASQLLQDIAKAYPDNPALGSPYYPGDTSTVSRFGAGAEFERSASALGDNGWHSFRRYFLKNFNEQKRSPVYVYLFNQTITPPNVQDWTGIPHGYDPPWWFGAHNFDVTGYAPSMATGLDTSSCLVAFVNKMDPNHFGLKYWPPYTQQSPLLFAFQGQNNQLISDDFRPGMSVFTSKTAFQLSGK